MLDDPSAPLRHRRSGEPPYLAPFSPLPIGIVSRQVTLRDRTTSATLIPFSSPHQVPQSLLLYLCTQMNQEIEKGDTYPMLDAFSPVEFGPYWFANFGAVMIRGDAQRAHELMLADDGESNWEKDCLGSFYIKPNYPGRSSHICNAGFLVCDASRNRGVGRVMGEVYIDWAPKLGYIYSVFNLVYETNVASCRIWDSLGFKRIGRVKECGNLRSYPDQLIDAIIYGRDLGPEGDDYVTEERFDKIRFYLKHGKYPNGADRAEKSRLRSAATHYRLIGAEGKEPERLMLKGKEVISEPQQQYEIAKDVHAQHHGGINKTTAMIAEKYHWVRIKETVSLVIRNCTECNDYSKASSGRGDGVAQAQPDTVEAYSAIDIAGSPGLELPEAQMVIPTDQPMNYQSRPVEFTRDDVIHQSSSYQEHATSAGYSAAASNTSPTLEPLLMEGITHSFGSYITEDCPRSGNVYSSEVHETTASSDPGFKHAQVSNTRHYPQSDTAPSYASHRPSTGLPLDHSMPASAQARYDPTLGMMNLATNDARDAETAFAAQRARDAMAKLSDSDRDAGGRKHHLLEADYDGAQPAHGRRE